MMDHVARLRALRRKMSEQKVEAMLITALPDVRYLCGFTGSNAALVVTGRRATLYTDGRYTTQAKEETSGARVVIAAKSALKEACTALGKLGVSHAFFDPSSTTVAQLAVMKKEVRGGFFVPAKRALVGELRERKDTAEIALMERAAQLGCDVFDKLLPKIESGVSEMEIAAELEYLARKMGAEAMSFETIVASGSRSALPHGRATEQKLPANGFITLDFGVILNGYCSDMTRTVHLGEVSRAEREAYDAVLEAQQAGVSAVKPGATCDEVDEAARSVLKAAGLAKFFTHSTGHGVGLEIHETPRLAQGQRQVLEPGMVVTIEPGIYIAGRYGIRIEDMVLVTEDGGRILTPASKALIEL
ncbi:Xaa-Pro peptidase family protein [Acidipila rosea]